jgi:hypothetical protein
VAGRKSLVRLTDSTTSMTRRATRSHLWRREVTVRIFTRGGRRLLDSLSESAYYMVKVLLAMFIGLARRPPVPGPGGAVPVAADHGI